MTTIHTHTREHRKLLQASIRANKTGHFIWVGSDSWGAKSHPVRDQEFAAVNTITVLPQRTNLKGKFVMPCLLHSSYPINTVAESPAFQLYAWLFSYVFIQYFWCACDWNVFVVERPAQNEYSFSFWIKNQRKKTKMWNNIWKCKLFFCMMLC